MLNIQKISNLSNNIGMKAIQKKDIAQPSVSKMSIPTDFKSPSADNLRAYIPSFTAVRKNAPLTDKEKIKTITSKLERVSIEKFNSLAQKGILADNTSNDGSTVLDNMYQIATQPRMRGLSDKLILSEVINALDNPASITQKFGDIPNNVANQIALETGTKFPDNARNVVSSSCVVASMEYNLASKTPAEFVRFVQGLSSQNYSVERNIKLSNLSDGMVSGLWQLREFGTDCSINKNWEDVTVKIKPDRNAIVRARVQSSFKDPGERSCVDVLVQSALLNLGSQHSYDAMTDERTGKFNPDKSGLTDFEKNFVEQIIFGKPKISVVYQNLDENGKLVGYNCELSEMKQHILKSLEQGENVIIGYTHLNSENIVEGGHEITITGYETDANGNGVFICNDTDDNIDSLIRIQESELLPTIHHAGIPKEALNENDVVVESWREILDNFKAILTQESV